MRNAFADEVRKLAAADDRVVLLAGDIGNRLFNPFKDEHPDRFFNCGIAEANMTSVAAGMALSGLRPITYTITPFVTTRCLEQIRVDVCYHEAPVVIVGVGGGLSYAQLGPTHHSCEDIGFLRLLPNMSVVCPADAMEVRSALRAALAHPSPVYLRLGKKGEPVIHPSPPDFEIGRSIPIRPGTDVCLLSCGNMLPAVLTAADALAQAGISARVESFHTVKPLDEDLLEQAFASYPVVVTIEEHSLIGGLGGAVAEWLAARPHISSHLVSIGTPDVFLHEAGRQAHARNVLGISPTHIRDRVVTALGNRAAP